MKLPQMNSTNLSTLKDLFDQYSTPTIKKKLKQIEGLEEFVMEQTQDFPKEIKLISRAKAIVNENPCKCENCGVTHGSLRRKFCSVACDKEFNEERDREYHIKRTIEQAEEKFKDSVEGVHYVICLECGCKTYNLEQHLSLHQMDIEDYKSKHPGCSTSPSIKSQRFKGESNPAFGHGGKYSPFSKKFVNYEGKTEEEINERIGDAKKKSFETKQSNPQNEQTRIEYYLSRGLSMEDAKQALYDRQNTFSLDKLISKYGEEEGTKRWKDRQDKWQATLNNLPEEEKIMINAKKGFWRYTNPTTDMMDVNSEFNKVPTKLYVIEYCPYGSEKSYIKVGVTSKYLHQRFPTITVKEELLIHESDRFTNFHIERDVKKFIFENNLSILLENESDRFDGWTECVDTAHKESIMEVVHEAIRKNT